MHTEYYFNCNMTFPNSGSVPILAMVLKDVLHLW